MKKLNLLFPGRIGLILLFVILNLMARSQSATINGFTPAQLSVVSGIPTGTVSNSGGSSFDLQFTGLATGTTVEVVATRTNGVFGTGSGYPNGSTFWSSSTYTPMVFQYPAGTSLDLNSWTSIPSCKLDLSYSTTYTNTCSSASTSDGYYHVQVSFKTSLGVITTNDFYFLFQPGFMVEDPSLNFKLAPATFVVGAYSGCNKTATASVTMDLPRSNTYVCSAQLYNGAYPVGSPVTSTITMGTVSGYYTFTFPFTLTSNGNYHVEFQCESTTGFYCTFGGNVYTPLLFSPYVNVTGIRASGSYLTMSYTPITCIGPSTGSASVTVVGGTGGDTYDWGIGSSGYGPTISGLSSGTYGVTVDGCLTGTVSIPNYTPLSVSLASSPPYICSGPNVTVTATINNGVGPYVYLWSDGSSISGVTTESTSGTYGLTVIDGGCTASTSINLLDMPANPAGPDISIDQACAPACVTLGDPSLTSLSGYTFAWYQGLTLIATTPNVLVCPGATTSYVLSVSPALCGQNLFGVTVTVAPHSVTLSSVPIIDCGNTDDCVPISITLSGYGVGDNVTVDWGDGSPLPYVVPIGGMISSGCLAAGDHNVIVTDANGCQESIDFTIAYKSCCHIDQSQFTLIDASDPTVIALYSSGADINWYGNVLISNGVLEVTNGTTLNIKNADVVFADQISYIYTHDGGNFFSDHSIFEPCDLRVNWQGLKFDYYYQAAQINDCTVKNALFGIWLGNGNSDINVTNNTLLNNNVGVIVGIDKYNGSISGNTFKIDVNHAILTDPGAQFFGIQLVNGANVNNAISQNNFIDALLDNTHVMHGIFARKASFMASENNFTNLFRAFDVAGSSGSTFNDHGVSITNNNIEYTFDGGADGVTPKQSDYHMIRVSDCTSPLIESNTLVGIPTGSEYFYFTGIYLQKCRAATVIDNKVDGFTVCIDIEGCGGFVLNNTLRGYAVGINAQNQSGSIGIVGNDIRMLENIFDESSRIGIYAYQLASNPKYKTLINGNYIDMTSKNITDGSQAIGIYYDAGLTDNYNAYVHDNCVYNTFIALLFQQYYSATELELPNVRNNYLYNYESGGLAVVGFHSNIGNQFGPTDFGANSFISNHHSTSGSAAYDIYAVSSTLTSYRNSHLYSTFGSVTVTPDPDMNSAASCGNQDGAHNDLEVEKKMGKENVTVNKQQGVYQVQGDIAAWLAEPQDQNVADDVLAVMSLLNKNTSSTGLDNFYTTASPLMNSVFKPLVDYTYNKMKGDLVKCDAIISAFIPTNQDLSDFKTIAGVEMKFAHNHINTTTISRTDLVKLSDIDNRRGQYAAMARDIINEHDLKHDYLFNPLTLPSVLGMTNQGKITYFDQNAFNVYPNPAVDAIALDYVLASEVKNAVIKIDNVFGQRMIDVPLTAINGTMQADVSEFAQGIYIATLYNGDSKVSSVKFIKK